MAKQSSVNLDITNNADGFDISGGTTSRKLGVTGGDVTIAGSGSAVVTFPTTSTTIAGLGIAQSFTALQTFSAGISASGATFTGNISASNIVSSFNGLTGAVTGISSFNGVTGAVTGVSSFNGLTGVVSGVTTSVANTFTALNTFSAGISASGATFTGNIKIPVNTTGAVTIGTHATKNLTLGSIGGAGEIVQAGGATSTLNIRQEGGGVVSIGDYTGAINLNEPQYISVDASGGGINLSGSTVQTDCNSFVVNAGSSSTFTGTVTVPTPINGTDAANKTYVDSTGVQTFNGATGAVTGATLGANTFTQLNTFSAGISASGATFSGPIISTGYQISSGAINGQTGSYSLVAGDNGKIVTMNVASANNLTVPASLAVGFNCTVIQLGAGQTTILASGTTLNSYQSYLKISGQHGSASIVGYTSNVYNVAGNLSA